MGRKKKKKGEIPLNELKKMFDVKANLRKLKGNSGYEAETPTTYGETESNIFEPELGQSTETKFQNSSTSNQNSNYEFELGLEKLKSELKDMDKDLETKINTTISDVKESKLDKSLFWKVISAIIGAAVLISGLIYTLSYSDICSDVEDIDDKLPTLENQIDDNTEAIEDIKLNMKNKFENEKAASNNK